MPPIDYAMPYASARSPVFGRAAVATSQPLATAAGIEMLLAGGNAVDAAVAAAMTLTVVEPNGCGLGSDAFAIVWDGTRLHGLDASGRSPAGWTAERFAGRTRMPTRGWDAVTVPGAVSGWAALSGRFGRLPFERLAAPAIRHAREGFAVTPIIADLWARAAPILKDQPGFADVFLPGGRAPAAGETFRSEAHARSLEVIAATRGEALYRGALAEAIAAQAKRDGGMLSLDDLGEHQAEWVEPLSQAFAGHVVHELPPAGQGVATLMALGMLGSLGSPRTDPDDPWSTHLAIEATKLALADLYAHVADREAMAVRSRDLLDPGYLAERARLIDASRAGEPGHGAPARGGTVCLSAADADGMMISYIQSNYLHFGSGVVVPGTGISLQNRGAGFVLEPGHPNAVGPRKRPFHTIIPGFVTDADGAPRMAFGLMGGPMQAQGHVQLALRILAAGQNPQAAADAPRWRVTGGVGLAVEPEMDERAVETLRTLGHEVTLENDKEAFNFGGAQIVLKTDAGYVAGSDPRKDGMAIGL
ncbi:MAG TPA: gamma-glutamyltransferase family protein [Caulobacteraceae bacterium]|nr:gamma-glutamyltransferase family protein [Caulobacteraceae bacterium]